MESLKSKHPFFLPSHPLEENSCEAILWEKKQQNKKTKKKKESRLPCVELFKH